LTEPEIYPLTLHKDERGEIRFCNEFDLHPFHRFYSISSGKENQIRAWQGHKIERKVFLPLSGKTKIVLVEITDFSTPKAGKIVEFLLDFENPVLLVVPEGYANGIQFKSQKSSIMVFSNLSLQDSITDDFRFNKDLFYCWRNV
jgi:dTDP-4-dehydrorhamnose 3,5-epimerase